VGILLAIGLKVCSELSKSAVTAASVPGLRMDYLQAPSFPQELEWARSPCVTLDQRLGVRLQPKTKALAKEQL
jgi:hypothetical protein